jgi:hypothetical protein
MLSSLLHPFQGSTSQGQEEQEHHSILPGSMSKDHPQHHRYATADFTEADDDDDESNDDRRHADDGGDGGEEEEEGEGEDVEDEDGMQSSNVLPLFSASHLGMSMGKYCRKFFQGHYRHHRHLERR